MQHRTAVLVILVLSLSAARVLACELACEPAAAHQETTCHDEGDAGTMLVADAADPCEYGTMAPSLSALHKPAIFPPVADAVIAAAGSPPPLARQVRLLARTPLVPPTDRSPRTAVLRI